MRKKYEKLYDQYPEYVSKDQLSKICGISKKSATYLLESKIIPYIENDKQTWRYKIALADIITYLRQREQWGSMIPKGKANSRRPAPKNPRTSFSKVVEPGEESKVVAYFTYICADYPDVVTTADVAEMTGIDTETVCRMVRAGDLQAIVTQPRSLIPKVYVLELVGKPRYIQMYSNSPHFKKILGGYELWKTARS